MTTVSVLREAMRRFVAERDWEQFHNAKDLASAIAIEAAEVMELFRRLNQQGTTIIQVTHSEANAAYGSRIIQLKDGWIVNDTRIETSVTV